MKVCKKCNKTFPNDVKYCTECGEKLVEECTCPRCGADVEPSNKFCPMCGYNLKEGNKCSKCGAEIKPGSKFCPSCGEQLNQNQVIEPTKKFSKSSHRKGLHPAINFTLIGLFFAVTVVTLIGFFGNIATASILGYKDYVTIKYFYGGRVESLETLHFQYKSQEFYIFSLASFIIHAISYFGGLAGLLTTLGIGIYKVVVSCKTRTIFSRRFFLYILISILPYLSITAFMILVGSNFSVKETFGWGTSLLVFAAILSALCYVASYIFDGEIKSRSFVVKSLVSFSFICVVLISIFGVGKQISFKGEAMRGSVGVYSYFGNCLEAYSAADTYGYAYALPDLVYISFLFGAAAVFISLTTITTLTKASKPKIISGIVCVGVLLVTSLLSGILGSTQYAKAYVGAPKVHVGLGGGVVFTMIFSILAVGSLITALSLYKEE